MRTLKVLGFLLSYPLPETQEVAEECRNILVSEGALARGTLDSIALFTDWIRRHDLLDLQENYVSMFDRTPALSLHLFEHIHGTSRERGQALSDLADVYQEKGLWMKPEETPDYLPLFLEYLSVLSPAQARDDFSAAAPVLESLTQRLVECGSPYAVPMGAIAEALGAAARSYKMLSFDVPEVSVEASDFEALDSVWQEQFAFDRAGQDEGAACVSVPLRTAGAKR